MDSAKPIACGVDGCPSGWLCLSLDEDGKPIARVFSVAEALLRHADGAVTAIDIPIGLTSSDTRRCDVEARLILGPRKSSVFPAPVRCTLSVASYDEACSASFQACGKRLSKQTYGILPRIREVDTLLRQKPNLVANVFEVHPEVCFYFWNDGKPMRHPKQSGFGFQERFRLVEQAFRGTAEVIRDSVSRRDASDDDILDALAALWTARRIGSGTSVRLGNPPERDKYGLPMQMLA